MVTSFTYDRMRETQRDHGNNITTTRTYGRNDNLATAIDVTDPTGTAMPGLSFSYTYDVNKNVTAQTTGGVMSGYSFTTNRDNKDRLTQWQRTNNDTQSWNLTLVGDWDQFTDEGGATKRGRTQSCSARWLIRGDFIFAAELFGLSMWKLFVGWVDWMG